MKAKKPSTIMKRYIKRMDTLAAELIEVCGEIHRLNNELTDEDRLEVIKSWIKDMGEDYAPVDLETYGRDFQDADQAVTEIFNLME